VSFKSVSRLAAPLCFVLGCHTSVADVFTVNATYVVQAKEQEFIDCDPNCAGLGSEIEEGDFIVLTYRIDTGGSTTSLLASGSGFQATVFRGSTLGQRLLIGEPVLQFDDFTGDVPGGGPLDIIGLSTENLAQYLDDPDVDDEATADVVIWGAPGWFQANTSPVDAATLAAGVTGGVLFVEERNFFLSGTPDAYLAFEERLGGNLVTVDIRPSDANDGTSPETPLLPINIVDPDAPTFVFQVPPEDVLDNVPVWIDPDVALGYAYTMTGGEIAGIVAPPVSLVADADGYVVEVAGRRFPLAPGATLDLLAEGLSGVTSLRIVGIDAGLALDPTDPEAFVTGLIPVNVDPDFGLVLTQTPLTELTPASRAVPVSPLALIAMLPVVMTIAWRRRPAHGPRTRS